MGILLLFQIFLVLVTVGLVQHSSKMFRTVLGYLSSLFEAQKTIKCPKDESVSEKDIASQQISKLQAESQILSR